MQISQPGEEPQPSNPRAPWPPLRCVIGSLILLALMQGSLAQEPAPKSACKDPIAASADVQPRLNSPGVRSSKWSYPWWIIVHDSGRLEDTLDGVIDADDRRRIEHTANCLSTHQGEHAMEFCDAVAAEDGVVLTLSGGLPAYAGALGVSIDAKLNYTCSFEAVYPAPTNRLTWEIKKKELRLKSREFRPGSRIFGWLSVTFEEIDAATDFRKSYKIEGYFKPVLQRRKP
jgi:hypothetical protein